MIKHNIY